MKRKDLRNEIEEMRREEVLLKGGNHEQTDDIDTDEEEKDSEVNDKKGSTRSAIGAEAYRKRCQENLRLGKVQRTLKDLLDEDDGDADRVDKKHEKKKKKNKKKKSTQKKNEVKEDANKGRTKFGAPAPTKGIKKKTAREGVPKGQTKITFTANRK